MNRSLKNATLASILVLAVGLSGCASTSQTDQMKADIQTALDRSASAQSTADAALNEAKAARAAAERAEQAALDAKAAAEATNAKIDEMFKKSMNK
jgi:predicted ribosome quality control (RQC) complex YloA/Tae2 family protein